MFVEGHTKIRATISFGVPFAGAIFGLEVQQTGRLRYEGLAPALAASITADFIVESLGRHTPIIEIPVTIDWSIALRLVVVGIAAGLAARVQRCHELRLTGQLIPQEAGRRPPHMRVTAGLRAGNQLCRGLAARRAEQGQRRLVCSQYHLLLILCTSTNGFSVRTKH